MSKTGKGLSGMQLLSLAGFAACLMLSVWMWREGLFTSQERLNRFMGGMGHWAAAAFVLFQAVQVVVPVLPGGLGCLAGVGLFVQLCGHLRGQPSSLCHCTQLRPAAAVPDVPGKPH